MKKITMILAVLMLLSLSIKAERVTPEIARKVATTFLNNNDVKTTQLTDLSKAAGFPNLYIFSTGNSFVVMSADDCVKPILGYSLTNKFVTEGMPENISSWLQGYSDEIQWAIDHNQRATSETAQQWKDLVAGKTNATKSDVVVGPLIQTKWSQGSPFNDFCPQGTPTGCVATAMAQIMKFWNYPPRGIGSHDYQFGEYGTISADFGATTYDWDNMIDIYSSSSSDIQKAAVATLMYHCGVSVEMKYNPSESGSTSRRSSYSLGAYFNYDGSYLKMNAFEESKWIDTLKNELNHGRPILYSGHGNKGGHDFICDGYDDEDKFHFNWGWGGSSNGYFSITSITPGSYNFSSDQSAVINIKPLTMDTLPLVLTLNQTEGAINLNWTDSQNSISYNIYRNNALIASSDEATYTDLEPAFGSNVYYVRGLKNDTLSLPSNCESVTVNYPMPKVNDLNIDATDNNASLSWNASEWCFPSSSDNETFSYVDEERLNADNWYAWDDGDFTISWGQRFPSSLLASYTGKVIFDIAFQSIKPGAFDIIVYRGTSDNKPVEQIASQSITTARTGWNHVYFSNPITINGNEDLWIFVRNTDYKVHLVYYKNTTGISEGCYIAGKNPTSACISLDENHSWLICPYLTDGTYTYNLYDNENLVASSISDTTYTISEIANNAIHNYTVKANYYGGESVASNTASLALGSNTLDSLILENNDNMTIGNGSTLTVTGALSNADTANLVLEDGAQLIHNTSGVKATVKKSIAAHDTMTGWNFIASPVTENITPCEENGLLSGNYDLYYYDEPAHYWRNYKAHTNDFIIEHTKGYLYANGEADGTTLRFEGTLTRSDNPVAISNLSHSASTLNGFNLVGNPFTCNATINTDYYIIDANNNVVLAETPGEIAPCEGIFVKAAETDNYQVTFTRANTNTRSSNPNNCIDLVISQNRSTLDRARVRLGEGTNLEKFPFDQNNAQISLWQNGEEYAVAYADSQDEMPLNFKAVQDGTYTLGIESNSIDFGSLHLIDNITGTDVDLLVMPSYTFEAKTTDYASRFKLVFGVDQQDDPSTGSGTFAYINDGNIIINYENDATLQIVDMTGRVVFEGDAMNRVSTSGMTSGIYVLRLINGENAMTQKLVVK